MRWMIWHRCMILWKLPGSCLKPHEGHEAMRPTSTLLTSVGPCSVCIGTYARYDSVWSSHKVTLIYIYTHTIYTQLKLLFLTSQRDQMWPGQSHPSPSTSSTWCGLSATEFRFPFLCPSMPSFAFWWWVRLWRCEAPAMSVSFVICRTLLGLWHFVALCLGLTGVLLRVLSQRCSPQTSSKSQVSCWRRKRCKCQCQPAATKCSING